MNSQPEMINGVPASTILLNAVNSIEDKGVKVATVACLNISAREKTPARNIKQSKEVTIALQKIKNALCLTWFTDASEEVRKYMEAIRINSETNDYHAFYAN